MRKDKGFIATSIIYSFFLVFVTLFVGLIANYFQNKVLVTTLNDASWEMLFKINNTKISDLTIGKYVIFKTKGEQSIFKEDSSWILGYIDKYETITNYYFFSDLTAHNREINYKLSYESEPSNHIVTIYVYNELLRNGAYNNIFLYPNMSISLPTISIMKKIRGLEIDSNIYNALYASNGSYVLYSDIEENGYLHDRYYEYRFYRFDNETQKSVGNYCNAKIDDGKIEYNSQNSFGYINMVANSTLEPNFINYCYYSNPLQYTHSASDNVVPYDENRTYGDLIASTTLGLYNLRMMAVVSISNDDENSYIAGGKGTRVDPYIVTNGVKIS